MLDTQELAQCPHITLNRQNVGNQRWYKCAACPQKFKAAEWGGKVQVVAAQKEKP